MTKAMETASTSHRTSQQTARSRVKVTDRPVRRRGRKWLLRAMAVAVASLAAVLLAEIGLRLAVVQEGKRLATYDSVLGWRGRPHGTGIYARPSDNIAAAFTYNELGFRDAAVPPKSAGGKRLMLLGDSFVESLEVDYPLTFGAQLEQRLQSRDSSWDACVIGSQGYSTAQELLAFRKFQPVVEADLVCLCFYCGNDFQDNQRRRFAYLDDQDRLVISQDSQPAWKHAAQYFQRWLYESSHVVYLIKNSIESWSSIHLAPESKAEQQQSEDYQRNITEQLVAQLQREVLESGSRLAMVIIPARDDLKSNSRDKVNLAIQMCASREIPFVDLSPYLDPDHYFTVDLHFNPRGHQAAAEAIAAFLTSELWPASDVAQLPTDNN